jgi:hypothetical protein
VRATTTDMQREPPTCNGVCASLGTGRGAAQQRTIIGYPERFRCTSVLAWGFGSREVQWHLLEWTNSFKPGFLGYGEPNFEASGEIFEKRIFLRGKMHFRGKCTSQNYTGGASSQPQAIMVAVR